MSRQTDPPANDWLTYDTDDTRFTFFRDVLPPLTDEQYRAIRASIEDGTWAGRLVTDEIGRLLYGHDAYTAFLALGVPPRHVFVVKVSDRTAGEVRSLIRLWRFCDGGPLTREQTQQAVREQLRLTPEWSDRAVARLLGTTDKTVGRVRADLLETAEIPQFEHRGGRGITTGIPLMFASDRGQARRCGKLMASTARLDGKTLAKRTVLRKKYEQDRERIARLGASTATPDNIHLFHRDFRDLGADLRGLGIAPGTVDLVWGDPPWHAASKGLYPGLAAFALEWLKPGGLLGVYPGTMFKDAANDELRRHFHKVGELVVLNAEAGSNAAVGHLHTTYQPVLLFSRGEPGRTLGFADSYRAAKEAKPYHPWQRTLCETTHWLSRMTDAGQLVIDPFGGGFTTAVACFRLGRRCVSCDTEEGSVNVGKYRVAATWEEMKAEKGQ
jgi:hypothetical protein